MSIASIERIRCIETAPAGIRLVIVKVETNQPGLYGVGCATFTQRPKTVVEAVHHYLDPFLRGRNVNEIEDIFWSAQMSSYWRNGPVLNNALSGVDMALWDIKGKQAGMPVYELLGGKCRMAAATYVHASGAEPAEVVDNARAFMEQGFKHVRLQVEIPGQATYGTNSDLQVDQAIDGPTSPHNVFEPADYVRFAPRLTYLAGPSFATGTAALRSRPSSLPMDATFLRGNSVSRGTGVGYAGSGLLVCSSRVVGNQMGSGGDRRIRTCCIRLQREENASELPDGALSARHSAGAGTTTGNPASRYPP